MQPISRAKAGLETEDECVSDRKLTPSEAAHTRIQDDLKNRSEFPDATMKPEVIHICELHEKISHDIATKVLSKIMQTKGVHRQNYDTYLREARDDVDSLPLNNNVHEGLVHQTCDKFEESNNSETKIGDLAQNQLNIGSFNNWSRNKEEGIPCKNLERSSSTMPGRKKISYSKLPFENYTAKGGKHKWEDTEEIEKELKNARQKLTDLEAKPDRLYHQRIHQEDSDTRVRDTGVNMNQIAESRYSAPHERTFKIPITKPRPLRYSSSSESPLDKVGLRLTQDGMMRKKQINAMMLKSRKAPSFQVTPYSKRNGISEKSIDVYNRLYDYSKDQQTLGQKKRAKIAQAIHFYQNGMMKEKQTKNAMMLNSRKAASFQVTPYSKKDPHCYEISEKSIDVYNRLYDDSKHQQTLGKKKRGEIAQAINFYQNGMMKKKHINVMMSKTKKAANFQVRPYSKIDPHCSVYNRLYNDSKHQQTLGKKKRVEIAQAIRERRRGEAILRTTKKLPIAKAAELYYRQMEQVYATEQKKAELARRRGVFFIIRHIKV